MHKQLFDCHTSTRLPKYYPLTNCLKFSLILTAVDSKSALNSALMEYYRKRKQTQFGKSRDEVLEFLGTPVKKRLPLEFEKCLISKEK